jgi:signal transduction histidine kinase
VSWLRDASIRSRTLAITAVALIVALAAAATFVFVFERRAFMEAIDEDLSSTALVMAESLEAAVAFDDAEVARETLAALATKPDIRLGCVYQGTRLLASYPSSRDGECPPRVVGSTGPVRDNDDLTIRQPILVQGGQRGMVYLRRDLGDLNRQLRRQIGVLLMASILALLTGLLLTGQLQGFISNPIVTLSETARRITAQRDYSIRARADAGAEVAVLIDAFNDMLDQAEERTRELQQTKDTLENTVAQREALLKRELELSRLKDEFLATLSHELRTPLNAILGWSHMLQEDGFDQSRIGYGLAVIERNALAQSRLVEDLLDVSRVIAGKLKIESRPVHLSDAVRSALEVIRPAADAKQIRVQLMETGGEDLVLGDAGRLQQMIWNLLANAVKYTSPGGAVFVTIAGRPEWVELDVTDTGEGIDPAFLPFAFDLFRQGERATVLAQGGLGLGLSLVRRIAEMHGGTAELKSPGKGLGTTALVRLPHLAALTRTVHGGLVDDSARPLRP